MIDAQHRNPAGFTFVLWSGNPYVEVFRPMDLKGNKLSEAIPFEAFELGSFPRTDATLKKFGKEASDYYKMV